MRQIGFVSTTSTVKNKYLFYVKSSSYFAVLIILLYSLAGYVLLQLSIPKALRHLSLIIHTLHFYLVWKGPIQLKHSSSILLLRYTPSKEWILVDRSGQELLGLLQPGSICTTYFAVLYFKIASPHCTQTVWIFPDSLSQDAFRRLRKLLWWEL